MSDDVSRISMLEIAEMSRTRRPVAEPEPEDNPRTLFSVKGRAAWYEWVKGYADSRGMSVMGVIDFALSEQAKRDQFPKPMPKRMASN
jgi:hypothetical protein